MENMSNVTIKLILNTVSSHINDPKGHKHYICFNTTSISVTL